MQYERAHVVSLKNHAVYTEKWLQERIAEDPALLGLGDLVVKDVERRQPRAGRLDLLLADTDAAIRYEVELQLGATDEAHIIRTIEYWDIERSRYPQFDHVAVIVAEDITSRFLNVISLFNKAIPLVAIQLRALQVGDVLTLNATRVLDLMLPGAEEDDEPGQATDRSYWEAKGSPHSLAIGDEILQLVNSVLPGHDLKYNKHYIGLARAGVVDNFVTLRPRKEHLVAEFKIPPSDELTARIESSGIEVLEYNKRWNRYRVKVGRSELLDHRDLIVDLLRISSGTPSIPLDE